MKKLIEDNKLLEIWLKYQGDFKLIMNETGYTWSRINYLGCKLRKKYPYLPIGNIQWIHKTVNNMKWDFTTEELKQYCSLVY